MEKINPSLGNIGADDPFVTGNQSTTCAACGKPIRPGTPVGIACKDATRPYTHLARACCPTTVLSCGIWGDGQLTTLHELYPDKFPEGTVSLIAYIANLERMASLNLD